MDAPDRLELIVALPGLGIRLPPLMAGARLRSREAGALGAARPAHMDISCPSTVEPRARERERPSLDVAECVKLASLLAPAGLRARTRLCG